MLMLTRAEAGRRLAQGLGALVSDVPLVAAISPGGVRVASEIARALDAPLDVVAGYRLEVPGRDHSLFGAVADGSTILLPERIRALDLPEDYVNGLVALARQEVEHDARAWRGGAVPLVAAGRTVVLVDDGLSDAVLVAAAARALAEQRPRRMLYAAPLATPELLAALQPYCEEHCLLFEAHEPVQVVICDTQFEQTTCLEVGALVRRSRATIAAVS
jgi:putative phosphoribosyl transferase